jgi:hypothetical protein
MIDKTDKGRIVESIVARELREEMEQRDRDKNAERIAEHFAEKRSGADQLADVSREKESDADRYGEYPEDEL